MYSCTISDLGSYWTKFVDILNVDLEKSYYDFLHVSVIDKLEEFNAILTYSECVISECVEFESEEDLIIFKLTFN